MYMFLLPFFHFGDVFPCMHNVGDPLGASNEYPQHNIMFYREIRKNFPRTFIRMILVFNMSNSTLKFPW